MDNLTILVLALYLLYFIFSVFVTTLTLWLATNLLNFEFRSLKKAFRLILVFLLLMSMPVIMTWFVLATNNPNLRFDFTAMSSLAVAIILIHILLLFMIKKSYQEKWPKIIMAFSFCLVVLIALYTVLIFMTILLGTVLLQSELFNINADWKAMYDYIRGIGGIRVPEEESDLYPFDALINGVHEWIH